MPDTIGFIGLGVMGAPMAANLLEAGYALVVHAAAPTGRSSGSWRPGRRDGERVHARSPSAPTS